MRVLLVVAAAGDSGDVRQAVLLVRELGTAFCSHVCLLDCRPPTVSEPTSWRDLPEQAVTRVKCRWSCDPAAILRLRRLVRRYQPDCIHAWDATAAAYAAWARGDTRQLVITLRRDVVPRDWAPGCFARRHAVQTTLAICSQQLATSLRRWECDRVVYVPLGVAPRPQVVADTWDARAELEIAPEALLLGGAGRLTRAKGWENVLWAFEVLCAVQPQAHFLLCGEGRRRHRLARFAYTLLRADRVHFLRSRPMEGFWPQVKLAFQTGVERGMAVAALEAMAAGVPVIAAHVPGTCEYFPKVAHTLLVPPGNRVAIARAAYRLLRDPAQWREISAAVRQHVEERFSAVQMVERYAEIYRRGSSPGANGCGSGQCI